jgi:hypothetical protein
MKVTKTAGRILGSAATAAVLGLVLSGQQAQALPVDLGAAGPGNWAILEIGGASVGLDTDNLSFAAAPPYGGVNGNIGGGNISHITSSAGNFPINGAVYLGDQSTADAATAANATGGIIQNAAAQVLLAQAHDDAVAASIAAAALASSGGGVGVSSISAGGTLSPGVYNLSSLQLPNGAVLNLAAGGSYVFNISGTLKLDHAQILTASGLSEADVLFNVMGTQGVAFSGGIATQSVLHGIILSVNAPISLTPGLVVGEMISGENINIASGGSVQSVTPPAVPDAGSSLALLSIGLALLATGKRKFIS